MCRSPSSQPSGACSRRACAAGGSESRQRCGPWRESSPAGVAGWVYDRGVRLRGRRRPAGIERVPTEVLVPEVVVGPLGPVYLRLGPGRVLLDYPSGRPCRAIANVWPTDDGWAEGTLAARSTSTSGSSPPSTSASATSSSFARETESVFGWVAEGASRPCSLSSSRWIANERPFEL